MAALNITIQCAKCGHALEIDDEKSNLLSMLRSKESDRYIMGVTVCIFPCKQCNKKLSVKKL